jgi:alpha-amylase
MNYYAVQVAGSGGKQLLCVVGAKAADYTPEGAWKKVISGYHYIYYVQGIEPSAITLPVLPQEEQQTVEAPSFCTVTAGETCAFFEAPTSWTADIMCWAWIDNGDNFTGGTWPGVPCTLLGTASSGKKVYKWTYSGSLTTKPGKIIFSNNGTPQTSDLPFQNGGYYTRDGLKAVVNP